MWAGSRDPRKMDGKRKPRTPWWWASAAKPGDVLVHNNVGANAEALRGDTDRECPKTIDGDVIADLLQCECVRQHEENVRERCATRANDFPRLLRTRSLIGNEAHGRVDFEHLSRLHEMRICSIEKLESHRELLRPCDSSIGREFVARRPKAIDVEDHR